ncbi:hypothetical protein, partial [Serratia marcescens]
MVTAAPLLGLLGTVMG